MEKNNLGKEMVGFSVYTKEFDYDILNLLNLIDYKYSLVKYICGNEEEKVVLTKEEMKEIKNVINSKEFELAIIYFANNDAIFNKLDLNESIKNYKFVSDKSLEYIMYYSKEEKKAYIVSRNDNLNNDAFKNYFKELKQEKRGKQKQSIKKVLNILAKVYIVIFVIQLFIILVVWPLMDAVSKS